MLGTLPESPPDSGSEPPYSPDLHGLNQIQYHQHHYPQQIDTSMHLTEPQNEMHQNVSHSNHSNRRTNSLNFNLISDTNNAWIGLTSSDDNGPEYPTVEW